MTNKVNEIKTANISKAIHNVKTDTVIKLENAKKSNNNSNKIMAALNLKNQMKSMLDRKELMNDVTDKYFDDEEKVDSLRKILLSMTMEELDQLSDEEIDKLLSEHGFKFEAMEKILKDAKIDRMTFKRDFILNMKQSEDVIAEIDKALEELDRLNAENEKEMDKLLESFDGSMIRFMLEDLKNKKEALIAEGVTDLSKIDAIIESFNDSIDLKRILHIYKNVVSKDNLMYEYKSEFKVASIHQKYIKTVRSLGIDVDILRFRNFEEKYLEEKYHKYPNLFIFLMMRYLSRCTLINHSTRENDGVFISQFLTNLSLMEHDILEDEYKERFLNSIKNILDIYITE